MAATGPWSLAGMAAHPSGVQVGTTRRLAWGNGPHATRMDLVRSCVQTRSSVAGCTLGSSSTVALKESTEAAQFKTIVAAE